MTPLLAAAAALALFVERLPTDQIDEAMCLTEIIHYEANGEPRAGKRAVANVALTRAAAARFPNTLCRVLKAPAAFSHRARGVSLDHISLRTPYDIASFDETLDVVLKAMDGDLQDNTHGADHFFNPALANPGWAQNPITSVRVGQHRFVRLY